MTTKNINCSVFRGFVTLLLLLNLFVASGGCWASPETSASSVDSWPKATRQNKPWSRWWWMGNIVNEKDITTEMAKYAEAGLGGLEITPIYGVKGYEDRFINYLSPPWVEMLDFTLKEADRLDIGIDMATGTGWPFGGPWVGAEMACKNVVHKIYTLQGGESLNEPIILVQKSMVRAIGHRLDISELVEPIGANENLQALALEQVRFEKSLPLQVLMAYSDEGQTIELTNKVDDNGILDWVAPDGNWTLYAVFEGWHGKMVERAAPGGEGNVIDHFSEDALKKYLKEFDEAYASRDVSLLRAYFNDSYEVDDASGESNWTPEFFDEFQKRRGYDLREHLQALFGNDTDEKNACVLCDYRETISDLLLEEFTIPWYRWARGKGATTRNQAHGSPANLLDLYAASGIPETEGSDILGFKLASSAAHVMGNKLASSESATWLDEHFCASLGDVKAAVDRFFLGGINHVFYHGTTFSPPDEDWPGWLFYASVHFGPTNSFWKDFSALNKYVTRCQSFLQAGQPDNDILLYYPIYDSWSQPGRSLLQHFSASADETIRDDGQRMLQSGYTFDYISDRQLAETECRMQNAEYRILSRGGALYKVVVVPECRLIPLRTFHKLIELAKQGSTIIIHNNMPSDVPGWGNLDKRREDFQQALDQISFTEMVNPDIECAKIGKGKFLLGNDLGQLLSYASVKPELMVDHGLRFVRRKHASGHYYFIVNCGDEPVDGWIQLQANAKSIAIFNPISDRKGIAALRKSEDNMNEVYLQLAPSQSCILKTLKTAVKSTEGRLYNYVKTTGEPQQIEGTWTVSFVEGGPELPPDVEKQQLESWTNFGGEAVHPVRENSDDPVVTHKLFSNRVKNFSGTAKYTINLEFRIQNLEFPDGWLLDLGRVCDSAVVTLNGKELGTLIGPPYRILILKDQFGDKNVLEVKVSNLMANRIADLDRHNVNWKKFYNVNFPARKRDNRGPDGLFNASHWPPRDSGLIGPVTLTAIELMNPQFAKGRRLAELPVHDPFILPHKQNRTYYLYTSAHPKLTCPWEQLEPLVYGDSGHGMLFKTFNGQLMLVLHQPFRWPLSRAKIYEMEDVDETFRVVRSRHDLHGK
jgi:hypothetical protein